MQTTPETTYVWLVSIERDAFKYENMTYFVTIEKTLSGMKLGGRNVDEVLWIYIRYTWVLLEVYTVATNSSRASCHSLIVADSLVPEGDVVHASLGGSTRPKRSEHNVRDPLTGEDIATDNRCSVRWIQHAAFRDDHLHWLQTSLQQEQNKETLLHWEKKSN